VAKNKARKVAVDSCLVICRIIGDRPEYTSGIASLFHEVDTGEVVLFGSTLLLTEVVGGGFADPPDLAKENQIRMILENPKTITLVQVTRQVALIARDLRASHRLKTPDAIHLASAIFADVDIFMTTDKKDFPIGETVHGVEVSLPRSAWGNEILS
jgi:predicted nucleic acid-binding protein